MGGAGKVQAWIFKISERQDASEPGKETGIRITGETSAIIISGNIAEVGVQPLRLYMTRSHYKREVTTNLHRSH